MVCGRMELGGAGIVLSDIIIFLMVAGLLGGLIYVMASPNRYAKMTDEEFEEDTKSSCCGSFQKITTIQAPAAGM